MLYDLHNLLFYIHTGNVFMNFKFFKKRCVVDDLDSFSFSVQPFDFSKSDVAWNFMGQPK